MINTTTNTVVTTVPVGANPIGVAITPNGAFAYVANGTSSSISIINTTSNTVVATIPGMAVPIFLAVTPNGAFVYVSNALASDVRVIDTATNTIATKLASKTGARRRYILIKRCGLPNSFA
jgi:YVTN family beta-propeller protein